MESITYNPQRPIIVTVVSDSSNPSAHSEGFRVSREWEKVVDGTVSVEPTTAQGQSSGGETAQPTNVTTP